MSFPLAIIIQRTSNYNSRFLLRQRRDIPASGGLFHQQLIGKQPEPVGRSSGRDGLMAQVEERTAGLCKEIPHLTVQQLACSKSSGPKKGGT